MSKSNTQNLKKKNYEIIVRLNIQPGFNTRPQRGLPAGFFIMYGPPLSVALFISSSSQQLKQLMILHTHTQPTKQKQRNEKEDSKGIYISDQLLYSITSNFLFL